MNRISRNSLTRIANVLAFLITALTLTASGSAQTFKTLFSFTSSSSGGYPGSALVQGTDGNLYGTTITPPIVFKMTPAGTLTTIYTFTGESDGNVPLGLTLGTDRVLYGITEWGGLKTNCGLGCGTVFKITEAGVLTTLHSFDASDGTYPVGTLIQGSDGNFYGTTAAGGANDSCSWQGEPGCGTIFKISASGTFTTLHSFNSADGSLPIGGLIQGSDGNFYGTTSLGGAYSGGTVFKITASGTLTTLYNFCAQTGCTDGQEPEAGLMQAADGKFYGSTVGGGDQYCWYGAQGGTIFKITSKGKLTTLHSFCFTEGRGPAAPLIQVTDGDLYGSAEAGGNGGEGNCTAVFDPGCGTLFKVNLTTALTTAVHTFNYLDGDRPDTPLLQALWNRQPWRDRILWGGNGVQPVVRRDAVCDLVACNPQGGPSRRHSRHRSNGRDERDLQRYARHICGCFRYRNLRHSSRRCNHRSSRGQHARGSPHQQ